MVLTLPIYGQVVWQVVSDKGLPVKNLNEIKSVLVSALASHGMIADALDLYEEITQAKFNLEPKAIISLIVSLLNASLVFSLYSLPSKR